MSNSIPALFKTSLIAAAVVSLSACSTAPRTEGYELSRVGEGILTAGRVTADVSERVWSKTTYLLGFSDDDTEPRSDDVLLRDAEDMAQLENSTVVSRDTTIRPIVIRSAIPTRPQQDETPINAELAENNQTSDLETPTKREPDTLTQAPTDTDATDIQTESDLVAEDRVHKVAASETLWDIAKIATGDANNWHVLADVNNLGPNASVFPGDLLIIPADMIKPSSIDNTASETTNRQAPEQIFVDTQNLTGTINSQASAVAAQPQLEASTTVQAEQSDTLELQQTNSKAFTLNPGETLWDLAKRTTGDATNWKAIAGQNNFSAEQASFVRSGQTIYVPEDLIKPDLKSATTNTATLDLNTVANNQSSDVDTTLGAMQTAADTPRIPVEPASIQKTDALRTMTISSASTLTDVAKDTDLLNIGTNRLPVPQNVIGEGQPIKIVEATFKPDEVAAPQSQTAEAIKDVDSSTHSPEQIMVSGTYYPKAIYNNADFSSSLLMRVSPGTTLQVSKAMGNWYQVKTSKGLGYVHQRDIK